jgi:hypothetical protein
LRLSPVVTAWGRSDDATGIIDSTVPGAARLVQVGGDGTPAVDEFAITELVKQVVIDTDPDAADRQGAEAKDRRDVALDAEDDHGMVTGGFCADADDALRFYAAVDQVADWLGQLGDHDLKPIRRAKALGYLANPHQLLALTRRAGAPAVKQTPDATGPWPEVTLYVHLTRDQWNGTQDGAARLEGVGAITSGPRHRRPRQRAGAAGDRHRRHAVIRRPVSPRADA